MRAVVINLDQYPDRLGRMYRLAESHNIKLERIAAVNGRDPANFAEFEKHRAATVNDKIISNTDMACALSHRKAWKYLLDSADEWLAVFEDDIHMGKDFSLLIDSAWIPRGVELVKLEARPNDVLLGVAPVCSIGHRRLYRLGSSYLGAAGYMISRKAAGLLLKYTEKMDVPVDSVMFGSGCALMSAIEIHQVLPAACIQEYELAKIEAREDGLPTSMIRHTGARRPFHKSLLRRVNRKVKQIASLARSKPVAVEPMQAPQFIPFE
ncbi:MAG: glycosyltransferase family 25 protein [Caulobacteraceae bacterium]|nr:glycosyltransferase family 25 protein [Caulobacteraceae bacterium]